MVELGSAVAARPVMLGVSLKLYLDVEHTARWAREVAALCKSHPAVVGREVEVFVLPSLPSLPRVLQEFADTTVRVGAQDLHWDDRGAYTGAISGEDLRAVGCALVEVGHAERRTIFGESSQMITDKVAAAFRNRLIPVLCVGEHDRISAVDAAAVCVAQVESALQASDTADAEIIVAYEPAWAIGRGEAAATDHVATVVTALRKRLHDDSRFDTIRVIYGGSAQPGSLTQLGGAVDGLFLGRFAHDPRQFARILDEAVALP